MVTIRLKANGCSLMESKGPTISSGNVASIGVEFEGDSCWEGYSVTAVFRNDVEPNNLYEVPVTDGLYLVPAEALIKNRFLYVGFRGQKGSSETLTTTMIKYKVHEGALPGNMPTPGTVQENLDVRLEHVESSIQIINEKIIALQENKVGKEKGKSLIADSEIERLLTLKNYDDSGIKETIVAKADQTEVDSLKEDLANKSIALAIKCETEESELIHIDDSADYELQELHIFGKSTQQAYTGKNLLKNNAETRTVNGITFKVNSDKTISISGTASANTGFLISNLLESDNILNSLFTNGGKGKFIITGNNTYNEFTCNISIGYIEKSTGIQKYIIPSDGAFTVAPTSSASVAFSVASGNTVNVQNMGVMILNESETNLEYEPYVGGVTSPNPNYPQDIVAVINPTIGVCGKNLIDFKNAKMGSNVGMTTKLLDNGGYSFAGTPSDQNINIWFFGRYKAQNPILKLRTGLTYTAMNLVMYDEKGGMVTGGKAKVYPNEKYSFTVKNDTVITGLRACHVNVGREYNEICYPYLMIGAGEYEPYQGQSQQFIATLNGIGDVKDEICEYNGQIGVLRKTLLYEFNGTEKFAQANKWFYNDRLPVPLYNPSSQKHGALCTIYEENTVGKVAAYEKDKTFGISTESYGLRFAFYDSSCTTVEQMNEKLKGQKILYKLATPTFEPFSEDVQKQYRQFKSYYPVTNIFTDTDAGIKAVYVADPKTYIDNQILELSAALVDTATLQLLDE